MGATRENVKNNICEICEAIVMNIKLVQMKKVSKNDTSCVIEVMDYSRDKR